MPSLARRVLIVGDRKLPGRHIERGTQVVGNVSHDRTDTRWRRRVSSKLGLHDACFWVVEHLRSERRSGVRVMRSGPQHSVRVSLTRRRSHLGFRTQEARQPVRDAYSATDHTSGSGRSPLLGLIGIV